MSNVDASTEPSAAIDVTIDYEQPLNERMRTFLRLEFLYQQLNFHKDHPEAWSTRSTIALFLEILAITARGDIRGDVLKELERQMAFIHEFQSKPGADSQIVRELVAKLAQLRADLNSVGTMFMQRVRDSEFLNAIKHRSAIPGGTCEFDLPDYCYWLRMPFEIRITAINDWLTGIKPLCESVIQLLWITRQNARPRREIATGGVFHLTLDKTVPCQLIRITLAGGTELFPEISGSHHRCSIRFMQWIDVNSRPIQAAHDVPFLLTTCT